MASDSLDELSERDNQPTFEDLMAADDLSPPRRTTPARSEVSRLPLFGSPHAALPLNNSPRFTASTYSSRRKDKDTQSGPEPLPKRATPKKLRGPLFCISNVSACVSMNDAMLHSGVCFVELRMWMLPLTCRCV